jgi:hypothetical protein
MSAHLFLRRRSLRIALATSLCACAPVVGETIQVTDATFDDISWSMTPQQYGPNGGNGVGYQIVVGGAGDNGPAREVVNTCGSTFSGSYNASTYLSYVYNPATQGAITSLEIAIDSQHTSSLCAMGGLVEQDGVVWMFDYDINSSSWTTYVFAPANDWYVMLPTGTVGGPGPDLSEHGTPLRFGFWSGNGSGGGFGYSTQSRFDNFRVTIEHVPPPCPGDINHDNSVDGGDLGILLGQWGTFGSADLNNSGEVDGADLGILLGEWGSCS